MPQIDRHRKRILYIEFNPVENLNNLPYEDRLTLVFITTGKMSGLLRNHPFTLTAPGFLCLNENDTLEITKRSQISAQSFCFHPDFLDTAYYFNFPDYKTRKLRIEAGLSLFQHDHPCNGIPRVTEQSYLQFFEWFFILGMEVQAQSNIRWVCRIKKYLIQVLWLLEDLSKHSETSPIDSALEYIYANYANKIRLEDLTDSAHINRVSLNKLFQERYGCTAMGYLQSYRMKVAEDLLTHTGMSLDEVARSTGYVYDTYFIKQFTTCKQMTPTQYRIASRKAAET